MIDCPCIDCICLAMCRQKMFSQLATDCGLIPQFVLVTESPGLNPLHRDPVRMRTLERILRPECWYLMPSTFKHKEILIIGFTEEGQRRYGKHRGERCENM